MDNNTAQALNSLSTFSAKCSGPTGAEFQMFNNRLQTISSHIVQIEKANAELVKANAELKKGKKGKSK